MNWAHLHLILNHIPVYGAFLITGLIILSIFKKDQQLTQLSLQFSILIGLFTLAAYFTGEPSEEIVEHLPGVSESLISKHENIALFALIASEVVASVSVYGLFLSRHEAKTSTRFKGRLFLLSLMNILMMTWTAYLGGQIRHTEIRESSVPQNTDGPNPEHPKPNGD